MASNRFFRFISSFISQHAILNISSSEPRSSHLIHSFLSSSLYNRLTGRAVQQDAPRRRDVVRSKQLGRLQRQHHQLSQRRGLHTAVRE